MAARLAPVVEAAVKLLKEVYGLRAFEDDIIEVIGRTNWAVLVEKSSALESALRSAGCIGEDAVRYEQCAARVHKSHSFRPVQCSRKAGYKDSPYCKQHHPDEAKRRRDKAQEKWEAERAREAERIHRRAACVNALAGRDPSALRGLEEACDALILGWDTVKRRERRVKELAIMLSRFRGEGTEGE